LSFFFTDAQGLDSETRTLKIPANGQIVGFLNEPLFASPQDFQGTMTFYASAPIGVLAVRGSISGGMFLMPQIPVADIGSRATGTVIVPFFWAGNAAVTEMILVNPTDSTLSGTFSFVSAGSPGPVGLSPSPSSSGNFIYDYAIPPRSSVHYTATLPDPNRAGFVQVVPNSGTAAPLAFNIVDFQNQGIAQAQTTVFGQSPATAFSLLVQTDQCCGSAISNTTSTTVSLANPSGSPIVVTAMGRSVATITVPERGQVFFSASDITGGRAWAVRFTSNSPFCIAGLQEFQLVPHGAITGPFGVEPIPDGTSASPLLVLPHLVEGLYSSTIYAFKNSEIQSSTAELEFFSQEGAPADIADLGRR
jgi:hypothetical protein